MICLDTLRCDRLGVYGNDAPLSPFLDEISRSAAVFTHVISQTPSTVTSHRAVFTSRYLSEFSNNKPGTRDFLAGKLSAAQWRTAAFVDGGLMNRRFGNNPGFQVYDDKGGGLKRVGAEALAWLDTNPSEPFFLFVHTYDIHCPYTAPAPYTRAFAGSVNPGLEMENHCGRNYFNLMELSDAQFSFISGSYNGGVRYCDDILRRFWAALKEKGLLDSSVVVIFSDHGESLGERGYVGHRQLYDVQLRVPLLLFIPGYSGRLIFDPVENIDIMPTLLNIFNIPASGLIQGRSLMPLVNGGKTDRTGFGISENHTFSGRAVTWNDWKLIVRKHASDDELYHLSVDPDETNNVIGEHPDIVWKMKEQYFSRTGARGDALRKRLRFSVISRRIFDQRHPPEPNDDRLNAQLKTLGYIN